jgi:hypothetical protein
MVAEGGKTHMKLIRLQKLEQGLIKPKAKKVVKEKESKADYNEELKKYIEYREAQETKEILRSLNSQKQKKISVMKNSDEDSYDFIEDSNNITKAFKNKPPQTSFKKMTDEDLEQSLKDLYILRKEARASKAQALKTQAQASLKASRALKNKPKKDQTYQAYQDDTSQDQEFEENDEESFEESSHE